jgi:small redox-active disulfide protein 2
MDIKVLGPGCYSCQALTTRVELAADQLGIEATVQHVHDYETYATYGILFTPGLVINGKLVSAGRVPTVKQICALLEHAVAQQSAYPIA